jgi:hypothetical protein
MRSTQVNGAHPRFISDNLVLVQTTEVNPPWNSSRLSAFFDLASNTIFLTSEGEDAAAFEVLDE